MRILTSIELTDEQVKKIGWDQGKYADGPLSEDHLDATLSDYIEDLPNPPDTT